MHPICKTFLQLSIWTLVLQHRKLGTGQCPRNSGTGICRPIYSQRNNKWGKN